VFDLSRAGLYLPLVGLPVWLLVAATGVGTSLLFPVPVLVVGVVLTVQYFAFNLFHFDGLLDSADALLYISDPSRRQEILKDHRVGSFALFSGFIYLAVKFGLLLAFARSTPTLFVALLVLAYPVSGRVAAGIVPLIARPLRQDGLGAYFHRSFFWYALLGIVVCLAPVGAIGSTAAVAGIPALTHFAPGLVVATVVAVPLFAAIAAALFATWAYHSRIGGMVGDGYGMAVELGELVHLCILAVLVLS
jgi:adenosylcobinamide-GDP ribazoletransferase